MSVFVQPRTCTGTHTTPRKSIPATSARSDVESHSTRAESETLAAAHTSKNAIKSTSLVYVSHVGLGKQA